MFWEFIKKNTLILWIFAGIIIFLSSGFFFDKLVRDYVKKSVDKEMLSVMEVALSAGDPEQIKSLSGTPEDVNNKDYIHLKGEFVGIENAFKSQGIDGIYAMRVTGGSIYFLFDSFKIDEKKYSSPGLEYLNPPKILYDSVAMNSPQKVGPYSDEYGTFVSYFSPIKTSSGQRVGIMGVDVVNDVYQNKINTTQSNFLIIYTIAYFLVFVSFLYIRNTLKFSKELKDNEEKFRTLYETASDAIVILDYKKFKFISANPAAKRLFGLSEEKDFVPVDFKDLSPERQPNGSLSKDEALKKINTALTKGNTFFEWTHKKYKGGSFMATVLLTKFEIGKDIFLQATIRDISKEKEKENELIKKREELEKLNNFMVGRELKMAELKKKIIELENKK